jgi:acyl-CoA thioesterase FadM
MVANVCTQGYIISSLEYHDTPNDVTGHVNNVMYNRYAESARVNWTRNFAASDPKHEKQWMELITPKSIGLILRSITTDYKFVSNHSLLFA